MPSLVEILNKQLADTIDLRSHIRQADFNIHSPYAQGLRELIEASSQDLQKTADTLTLAIRELGGLASGTVQLVARRNVKDAREIGDSEIVDILVIILNSVEGNLWFLEAHLEGIAVRNSAETLPRWTSVFDSSSR